MSLAQVVRSVGEVRPLTSTADINTGVQGRTSRYDPQCQQHV